MKKIFSILFVVLTLNVCATEHAVAQPPDDAATEIPARDFSCDVDKIANEQSSDLTHNNSRITIDGAWVTHRAWGYVQIPTWEKTVTYDAGKGYSIRLDLSAAEHKVSGDFVKHTPNFKIRAAIIKDGQFISQASTNSESVTKAYSFLTRENANLIQLNLTMVNLMPNASADDIYESRISCQMPISSKFTDLQMKNADAPVPY